MAERMSEEYVPSERVLKLKEELTGGDFTAEETSFILSLDKSTILRYLREGDLPGYQIGREWRIPENKLREAVKRMQQGQRVSLKEPPDPY